MDTLGLDFRYAVRGLRKTPAFTAIAVLTLAMCIGANTAIFSIVRGVLLEPLAYSVPNQLVLIRADTVVTGASRPLPTNYPATELGTWRRAQTFGAAFYTVRDQSLLSGTEGLEVLDTAAVSPEFFTTLAGPMSAGRGLGDADVRAPAVVISDRLARRLFNTPAEAVGRQLTLTSQLFTVVGVAGPQFQFPDPQTDVWQPADFMATVSPRCCSYSIIARLRPGSTAAQASAEAASIAKAARTANSASPAAIHARAIPLRDQIVADVQRPLAVLFAAVLLVLAVGCVNLVNLLLARNASRARDVAVRWSLGASSGRLIAESLIESALIAGIGASIGVAVAHGILDAMVFVAADTIPRLDVVRLDIGTLAFTAGLAVLTTIAIGVAPALLSTRAAGHVALGSTRAAASQPHQRLRRSLGAVQCAASFALLVGAVLLGRSLSTLLHTDLGVNTDHVLTASVNLGFEQRLPDAQMRAGVSRIVDHLRTVPGVKAVGVGTALPPNVSRIRLTLRRNGDSLDYQASGVSATAGYFSALQTRLIHGRFFTDADDASHPDVMIMSEETVRHFFDGDPVGQTLMLPTLREGRGVTVKMTLVGVIANVKYAGLAAPPDDAVYRPFEQQPWNTPSLVIRTAGEPDAIAATIRREIAAVEPSAVVTALKPLEAVVADAAAEPRFQAIVLGAFAGLALAIATVGLYGVIAYSVTQRTNEIGIRMALGADARRIRTMVLREGLAVGGVGVLMGAVGAAALVRVLAGLLYGVRPTDMVSFAAAGASLLTISVAASYWPARRASRIDPMVALRSD